MSERIDVSLEAGTEGDHLVVHLDPPASGASWILYLHGFGSSQAGEKALFFRNRALASGLGFCSFDFRGHGASGGSIEDLTLTRNLEDVARVRDLLDRREAEEVILLGSSMGGSTAMWYAAEEPDRVAAGLFLAPALSLLTALEAWAGEAGLERWEREGRIPFANELVSSNLGWGLIEDLRRRPVSDLRERFRSPSLLLQGKLDTSVDWRAVLDFVARCRYGDLELHLFGDGDHRLLDRKERLWALMVEFLGGRRLLAGR